MFAAAIAVPAVAWWRLNLSPVITFWACYVVTRPLGASIADWLGKPVKVTGLGLGDGPVTGLGVLAFTAMVYFIARRGGDRRPPRRPVGPVLADAPA